MATVTFLPNTPDILTDDYCLFCLATCYFKEDREFIEIQVIEPIPSAALGAILKDIHTSCQLVFARAVGKVI
ncbi:MAG: hypothetical protein ACQJCO_04410 [cyanobacterium endosymbiont of Rhopalodia sterrenbergii]